MINDTGRHITIKRASLLCFAITVLMILVVNIGSQLSLSKYTPIILLPILHMWHGSPQRLNLIIIVFLGLINDTLYAIPLGLTPLYIISFLLIIRMLEKTVTYIPILMHLFLGIFWIFGYTVLLSWLANHSYQTIDYTLALITAGITWLFYIPSLIFFTKFAP